MAGTRRVTLLTRAGCCLCDEALATIEDVRRRTPFDLSIVDVDSDPALSQKYGLEVPVVLIDGKKALKHHIDARGLEDRLAGRGIFARLFGAHR